MVWVGAGGGGVFGRWGQVGGGGGIDRWGGGRYVWGGRKIRVCVGGGGG